MVDVGSAGEDRVSRSAGLLAGGIGAAIARICWGLPREVGSGPRPAYRWAPPRAAANVLAAMPLADPHFSIVIHCRCAISATSTIHLNLAFRSGIYLNYRDARTVLADPRCGGFQKCPRKSGCECLVVIS